MVGRDFCRRAASLALAAIVGCEPENKPAEDTATHNECAESPAPPCPDYLVVTADATRTLPEPIVVPHGPEAIAVGDLASVGSQQIYVGTSTTITRLDGPDWSTVTDIWSESDDGSAMVPHVADLTEDGVADLVIGLPDSDGGAGQVLLFPGPVSGPVDWETPHFELQGTAGAGRALSTADYNGDGLPDLFVQGAGVSWIRFGPIVETTALGAASDLILVEADGSDWTGGSAGADFDGDGIGDLLVGVVVTTTDPCVPSGWQMRLAIGPFGAGSLGSAELTPLATLEGIPLIFANLATGIASRADLNNDGQIDILTLSTSDAAPGLYEMLAYAELMSGNPEPTMRFPITALPLGVVDWNGDGAADLIQRSTTVNGPTVLAGPFPPNAAHDTETCSFQVHEVWEPRPDAPSISANWLGDLENDGFADAILGSTGSDSEGLIHIVRSE